MKFCEKLNEYIELCGCTAKELSTAAGISAATLSRYRSGERVPTMDSEVFRGLCSAIANIASEAIKHDIPDSSVRESFFECSDFVSTDMEQFRCNFNTLIARLDVNISSLCQSTNYDTSTVFRIRNGTRQPSDPDGFATSVASYISRTVTGDDINTLAGLIGAEISELCDSAARFALTKEWLINGQSQATDSRSVEGFLHRLDEFDLNEYIKAIRFDEMKVPSLPFQLPTSKYYYGLDEMMQSELDFLKATVLSKSMKPVTLYSDMPMAEMAKDPSFPKKWMYGMALMLKKGLHLNNIHNIDRSFDEMMLGLEGWIPMYMTGQISPYYLKSHGGTFHHFLRVSGAAALSGEAIVGHHAEGRYYLSKTKEDITYYSSRAEALIEAAQPLMDIYREDAAARLNAFLQSDIHTAGKRRAILSAPPIYTMKPDYLEALLVRHGISENERQCITDYAAAKRDAIKQILASCTVEDDIPHVSRNEYEHHPMTLPLAEMFFDKDIRLTYEEYTEHQRQTEEFAAAHPNYSVEFTSANPFRNLQITIHEGAWSMISKGNTPAIHFLIHHPKLRRAIENFVPPVVEYQA